MEKIFDGMVSEEELVELSGTKQDESGAGFPWEIVIELVTDFICPTGGCTPRCAK
ncbi:MAG: class II lanthipeptide, LchA2/BrtA2 family [Butyrivibrio sp.]|nr:class II lanthipeptide, LchA2/BrtA2 family [Butyrivibrio sp.]MBR4639576.1 class II lanthipeptide, LchA2/BrtA2 family [Butyrivibrio sp.]MEE3470384.1 class II lanthipeptide, LchA2/BrtA2 family [Butyrivibrio hungatei]